MTLPDERYRAIVLLGEAVAALAPRLHYRGEHVRLPKETVRHLVRLLKHYPSTYEMEEIARLAPGWLRDAQGMAAHPCATDATSPAWVGHVERPVRPVAEVKSARLRWHLPTPDADPVAKFLDNETHPLYDKAALDAEVAAERERWMAAVEPVLKASGPELPHALYVLAGFVRAQRSS